MRVFHGGFQVGQSALAALVRDSLAIGRPDRPVLDVLGGGEATDGLVGDSKHKEVVVKELIFVRFPVGNEENFVPFRRPTDRVLIVVAGCELRDGAGADINEEQVETFVVVEARVAFVSVGLIEVACDDDRVAVYILRLGPR